MNNILFYPQNEFMFTNVQIWFLSGTINENKNENGLHHLLEHLIVAQNPFVENTFTYSSLNGATGLEITRFSFISLKGQVINDLDIFFKTIQCININDRILDNQKKVVINEIIYRNGIQVFRILNIALQKLFQKNGYDYVNGNTSVIKNVTAERMQDFLTGIFGTGQYFIAVSGALTKEEISFIKEKYEKKVGILDLKPNLSPSLSIYLEHEQESAYFYSYETPGKMHYFHILKILELYVNSKLMKETNGRFITTLFSSKGLFSFYFPGKISDEKIEKFKIDLYDKPDILLMKKMIMLYFQKREYRMQTDPNADLLEVFCYKLNFEREEKILEYALSMYTEIFSRNAVCEVFCKHI